MASRRIGLEIGYSGIGYTTSEVRAVPLSKTENDKLTPPTFENALKGTYPLGPHALHLCGQEAGEPLPPLVEEFLKFVLSKEGQAVVVKDGYGALPAKVVEKNRSCWTDVSVESNHAAKSRTPRQDCPLGGHPRRRRSHRERVGHPRVDPGDYGAAAAAGAVAMAGRGSPARLARGPGCPRPGHGAEHGRAVARGPPGRIGRLCDAVGSGDR